MQFKKQGNGHPEIASIRPVAAIPGGDIEIRGSGFLAAPRPIVTIGNVPSFLIVGSPELAVARVPENAAGGAVIVGNGEEDSVPSSVAIGARLADSLHPVANPAVDPQGNIFTTFSGSRGQKAPVAVFRIDPRGTVMPFLADMMNPTGLAFDSAGVLHVSSRFDGIVYQVTAGGVMSVFVEGMGVATGIAFDKLGNLFVGDRSGTIFKISPQRQIYVFATVEPSISAYHLAFGHGDQLFLTGPTTSSFDCVYTISPNGEVEVYYRGLGRPQGIAFDKDGNLYVAASFRGRRGIVRITPEREASLFLSGPNIVGLAFAPKGDMIVATTSAVYRVNTGVEGRPLP